MSQKENPWNCDAATNIYKHLRAQTAGLFAETAGTIRTETEPQFLRKRRRSLRGQQMRVRVVGAGGFRARRAPFAYKALSGKVSKAEGDNDSGIFVSRAIILRNEARPELIANNSIPESCPIASRRCGEFRLGRKAHPHTRSLYVSQRTPHGRILDPTNLAIFLGHPVLKTLVQ